MYAQFSERFRLNARDLVNGLVMTVFGAVIGTVLPLLNAGVYHFDWKLVAKAAAVAAVTYLSKNFVTNSKDQILP